MKVVHVAIALVTVVSLNAQFAAAGPITLNYNYNGLYQGIGDTTYTSISDRGVILNGSTVYTGSFGGPTTTSTQGAQDFTSVSSGIGYHFVSTPNVNDIVALTASGPQTDTTTLSNPVSLSSGSAIGVLYNYSNGGGTFNMMLGFSNNSSVTVTLSRRRLDEWRKRNSFRAGSSAVGRSGNAIFGHSAWIRSWRRLCRRRRQWQFPHFPTAPGDGAGNGDGRLVIE